MSPGGHGRAIPVLLAARKRRAKTATLAPARPESRLHRPIRDDAPTIPSASGPCRKAARYHHAARSLPPGCLREVEGYACPFVRLAPRRPIEDASAPVELDRWARKPFDHPLPAAETRSADSMQPTFQRRAPLLHEAPDLLDESEPASQTGEPRRSNGARPASAGWSCRRARMFSIRAFALRADL